MAGDATPGPWLNAHCHLELSFLLGKIPAGISFTEWLERLVALRRETPAEEIRKAADEALGRMIAGGTRCVLDICATDLCDLVYPPHAAITALLFREAIDFNEDSGPQTVLRTLSRQKPGTERLYNGLSPHAPYTTTGALLRSAASWAGMHRQWLCIHAAETPEETEMMRHGRGPLFDFLDDHLPGNWSAPGLRPIPWLAQCGCLGPRTLLVHCNDIDDGDIRLIASHGCPVVVCPGTHVYFDRGEFPLKRLLDAGIPVFLGTDSLASNTNLDMEREVELAAELSPGVPGDTIRSLASAERARHFLGV